MLVDAFHWPPGDLANADIDLVLPLTTYYPHWKSHSSRQAQEEQIYADQADWL
jgi:hypothetical protein